MWLQENLRRETGALPGAPVSPQMCFDAAADMLQHCMQHMARAASLSREAHMALKTITEYAVVHDVVEAEHPLLDVESLRPCLEHEARRLVKKAEEEERTI